MAKFKIMRAGEFDPASKKYIAPLKTLTEKQAIQLIGMGEPQIERGMTYAHHWKNFNPNMNRPCTSARACILTYVKYKLGLDNQKEELHVMLA